MKIDRIGHAAFTCRDLEKTVAFYRDVLGLKEKFRISYREWLEHRRAQARRAGLETDREAEERYAPRGDSTWIAYMEVAPGMFIELFDSDGATQSEVAMGDKLNYSHLSLETDDIFALYDALISRGVQPESEPKMGLEHTWQMWAKDPDGNRIEFMQYTTRSWQITGH